VCSFSLLCVGGMCEFVSYFVWGDMCGIVGFCVCGERCEVVSYCMYERCVGL